MGGNIVYSRTLPRPSGVISDGDTVVRTGPSATLPNVEWLGGLGGFVVSQPLNSEFMATSPSGWTLLPPSTSQRPTFNNEQTLNRPQCVIFDTRNTTEYKQTLFYDTGASGYSSMYTSKFIYLDHLTLTSGYLQWKMMRWTRTETVVDGDGGYMSNRPNSVSFFSYFNSAGQTTKYFDVGGAQNLPGRGAWYRYETWMSMNSSPGVADGTWRVKVSNPSTGATVVDNSYTDIAWNGSSDSGQLRYLVLQNYYGNADVGLPTGAGNGNAFGVSWWDDIYISWTTSGGGAQVRSELINASTYAASTVRTTNQINSIVGTSWSDKLNKGRHTQTDLSGLWLAQFNSSGTETITTV